MTTLTLDAALRQQALTQLGIAQVLTLPDVTPTDLVLMAQATCQRFRRLSWPPAVQSTIKRTPATPP